jgi:integral membrane protein
MKQPLLVTTLRIVAFIEGLSFILLVCVAMPLKYLWHQPEMVRVVGGIHGALVLGYIAVLYWVYNVLEWPIRRLLILIGLSFIPFGNFYADKRYLARYQR